MADSTPSPSLSPGDHIFLVDGSSFVFRAYFQSINQDAKYNYRADGLPTGALRLFAAKLYQFVREGAVGIRPTHLAIIFDKSEKTFRKEIYAEYKANRRETPEDLIPQFPLMREAVRAFGMEPVEKEGFEADDIIATYAKQASAAGAEVLIISADKDLMQLVGPHVLFYDFESGSKGRPGYRPERKIDVAGVIDYFGVPPEKVIDVQALVGDVSDNVPGVPGIGIKTAAQLINEFGNFDSLMARAHEIKQPKRRENLIAHAEQARISRALVTLHDDVAIDTPLARHKMPPFDPARLIGFFKAMGLTGLTKRIADANGVDPEAIAPADIETPKWRKRAKGEEQERGLDAEIAGLSPAARAAPTPGEGAGAEAAGPTMTLPAELAAARAAQAQGAKIDPSQYETIDTLDRLDHWIDEALANGHVALKLTQSSIDPMQAEILGIALSLAPGRACYVPLLHRDGDDLLAEKQAEGQLRERDVLAKLRGLFEDGGVLKIGHNQKADWLMLWRRGINLSPLDDVMLIAYALDAGREGMSLESLCERWLGHRPIQRDDVTGAGRARVNFGHVALDKATAFSGEAVALAFRLWLALKPRLVSERMASVYETLERPLIGVLGRMEEAGIKVDRQILSRMSGEFAQSMARLEAEITELAGESFNLASPKQLGDILFGKLSLPGGKKTKTGAWSTGADVLEELAASGQTLAARILDWRQIAKLKSTYTDALPAFIHPQTRRVHTSFALAATSTGRLSSSEPNLQNIPARSEEGRKIRAAFIAEPGMKLISADYSQIELRVLAHMADIPRLRQAFADGLDIHAMTASEMFSVPIEGMDPNIRRRAKAINFGIIYGISAFGLANQLGISRQEAGDYIQRYFARFPGIRDYMESSKSFCREHGFVRTIFGRKIHYPGIESKNPSERAFNERAAINAPIQGSAADIIRRAMIRMEDALRAAQLSLRMLLQVHDELIFEASDVEVSRAIPIIKSVMEKSGEPSVRLAVPLHVDARAADNWEAAH